MSEQPPERAQALANFMQALEHGLPDPRDKRGTRHNLAFVLACVAIAMLSQCQSVSSIYRFIRNRVTWLRRITRVHTGRSISRAHLPRLLDRIDRERLAALITEHFGEEAEPDKWFALDGKTLRGSSSYGEREAVVLAVAHATGDEVARTVQSGMKTSEIPVMRQLLVDSGLARCKVSMDAMHCNPATLAQVNEAGGTFLVQVKENQSELLSYCRDRALTEPVLASTEAVEKAHGRITNRKAQLIVIRPDALQARWAGTRIRCLVVMLRETYEVKRGETSTDASYYLSNLTSSKRHAEQLQSLVAAIRGHWRVESNNWVRDVTLGEDGVRVSAPNQGHVLALMRSLVLKLLRATRNTNLQATLEAFCQKPAYLLSWLRRTKFL